MIVPSKIVLYIYFIMFCFIIASLCLTEEIKTDNVNEIILIEYKNRDCNSKQTKVTTFLKMQSISQNRSRNNLTKTFDLEKRVSKLDP